MAALRAHLALARRDTAAALREFSTIPNTLCTTKFWYACRLAKAQLLSARRMDREGETLVSQEFPGLGPNAVLWTLHRARVYDRLGRKPEAVDEYAYVSAAWNRADPSLQPIVKEARATVARLESARNEQRRAPDSASPRNHKTKDIRTVAGRDGASLASVQSASARVAHGLRPSASGLFAYPIGRGIRPGNLGAW